MGTRGRTFQRQWRPASSHQPCWPRCKPRVHKLRRERKGSFDAESFRAIRPHIEPCAESYLFSSDALCWPQTPNQEMKPTAPISYLVTLLATDPARGLSLSR